VLEQQGIFFSSLYMEEEWKFSVSGLFPVRSWHLMEPSRYFSYELHPNANRRIQFATRPEPSVTCSQLTIEFRCVVRRQRRYRLRAALRLKMARASKAIAAPPRAPDTDAARARAYDFVQKSHIVDARPPRKIGSVAHRRPVKWTPPCWWQRIK